MNTFGGRGFSSDSSIAGTTWSSTSIATRRAIHIVTCQVCAKHSTAKKKRSYTHHRYAPRHRRRSRPPRHLRIRPSPRGAFRVLGRLFCDWSSPVLVAHRPLCVSACSWAQCTKSRCGARKPKGRRRHPTGTRRIRSNLTMTKADRTALTPLIAVCSIRNLFYCARCQLSLDTGFWILYINTYAFWTCLHQRTIVHLHSNVTVTDHVSHIRPHWVKFPPQSLCCC